jgi:hypothetical protein
LDVLEELTYFEPEIDRSHVEKRVVDWVERTENLYGEISAWLAPEWRAEALGSVRMAEPLMRDYGVPPRDLPVLKLFRGEIPEAELVPRALWIIGANGRWDLVCRSERFVIIDAAEIFALPKWKVSPFFRRAEQRDLTLATLRAILG